MFHTARTSSPKIVRNCERPQIATAILRKNKVGGIVLPDNQSVVQGHSNKSSMVLA